ncbi:hypothetical protein K2Z84_13220 [Candidatus Binatia bacterium]|nr:hypothetical protein [Candidatus Binatia bacterium]
MRVRRLTGRTVPGLLIALALAACGGSGSSGFDVTPGAFEAPLIERAIAEQRCITGDGELLICPSGVPVPDPDGGMQTPSPGALRIDAGLESAIDCNAGGDCMLSIGVRIEGLPEGAEVRVAVRAADGAPWRIGEPLVEPATSGGVVTPVDPELAGGAVMPGDQVQVAVLVFVPPLGDVPVEVSALSETGARYAFVLPTVTLVPGVSS